jgi:AraC-like DNA-binding protein
MAQALRASEGVVVAQYAQLACRAMARRGFAPEQVLAGTGLRAQDLDDYPGYLLSLAALLRLIENMHTLDPSPTLSFELGTQFRIGSHGFLGYAFQASPTLGEALALAHRFALTRTQLLDLRFTAEGDRARLEVTDNGLLGHWFPQVIETLLGSFSIISVELFGAIPIEEVEIDLSFARQPHHEGLRALTGNRIRFGCATTAIRMPLAWLAWPLPKPDAQLAALAAARCNEELQNAERGQDLLARVRKLAQQHIADPKAQESVAAALNITPRTLHRRLEEHGLNFKGLIDDLRRRQATYRLRHEDAGIADIAHDLGYSDQANFVRAFKRWTGMTPKRFRQD